MGYTLRRDFRIKKKRGRKKGKASISSSPFPLKKQKSFYGNVCLKQDMILSSSSSHSPPGSFEVSSYFSARKFPGEGKYRACVEKKGGGLVICQLFRQIRERVDEIEIWKSGTKENWGGGAEMSFSPLFLRSVSGQKEG